MKVLCVEDDQNLAQMLQLALVKQRYHVDLAADGEIGWDLAQAYVYDLILLDLMLPKLDGMSFCQQLRAGKSFTLTPNRDTPVILITALDAVTNKVIGLDAGADDYLVKPFNLEELLARIRALLRRNQGRRSPLLSWGELYLNPQSCEVSYRGQPILLAAKEYEILELFLRNPDQIFSPSRLLERVWAVDEFPSEGAVRAHMKGLRQKLRQAGADNIFETIYKLGYRLKQEQLTGENIGEGKEKERTIPPAPQSTASPPETSFVSDLKAVWLECQQSYGDRLAIIQQAVMALQKGMLSPALQHQAEQEAHTLSGSLGCFGLDEASDLLRQIQQILKQDQPLGEPDAEQLTQLLMGLQELVN
ncbi:MAG: response regulator [Gloeotrichia echinulata CP02]|nr:response regulator [Gloeotrichia echinulata DEX184]